MLRGALSVIRDGSSGATMSTIGGLVPLLLIEYNAV